MRKFLFSLILFSAVVSFGQTTIVDKMVARSNIMLRNKRIDSIQHLDTALLGKIYSTPTSDAVARFVIGRVANIIAPGTSLQQLITDDPFIEANQAFRYNGGGYTGSIGFNAGAPRLIANGPNGMMGAIGVDPDQLWWNVHQNGISLGHFQVDSNAVSLWGKQIKLMAPVQIGSLAGTGTRMMVTDAAGNVGAQVIPTGNNMGNAALLANGDYVHNWKGYQFRIDSASSIQFMSNSPGFPNSYKTMMSIDNGFTIDSRYSNGGNSVGFSLVPGGGFGFSGGLTSGNALIRGSNNGTNSFAELQMNSGSNLTYGRAYIDSFAIKGNRVNITGNLFINGAAYGSGSVSAVNAGYGITGGNITSTGTHGVDTTAIQKKLAAGSGIAIAGNTVYVSNVPASALSLADTTLKAFDLTTTGTSGAATYNPTTGVLNIPQYSGGGGSGTVTAVNAGYGITGGNITTTGTLGVDTTAIQKKLAAGAGIALANNTIYNTITNNNQLANGAAYVTQAGARTAISITTTGSSGAASYNNTTGVLNIPQYSGSSAVDELASAYAALGSTIKGQTAGLPWSMANGQNIMTAGQIKFMPVYVSTSRTITGAMYMLQGAGGSTVPSFTGDGAKTNGIALYSYSAGILTKVAETTNDANFWSGSLVWYTKPFATPYSASPGLYFFAFLWNATSTTAAPYNASLSGASSVYGGGPDFTNSAKFHFLLSGQSTFPATVNMSACTSSFSQTHVAYY